MPSPSGVCDLQRLRRRALDDRDELDVLGAQLVAQEPVHPATLVAVRRVQRGQHVPLHAVALEHIKSADHAIEGRLAALAHAVGVVNLPRAVDRDPDEELVLLQKRSPLVIEQRTVRLQRVQDPLPRLRVLLLQLDRAAEELQAHDRRLATLPRDHDLRSPRVPIEELADIDVLRAPQPSGSGCPDTASPWRGRSSTRSRGCRSRRSAWPSHGTPMAHPASSEPDRSLQHRCSSTRCLPSVVRRCAS